jgi:broad specificity phosphatase PhoE
VAVTTILLARHGESDWNVEQRWQGHADRPLTELGRQQARALADRLAAYPLDAVYSSDLRRALDTARAVAERRRLDVIARQDLREVDVGSWSGRSRQELASAFPDQIARWERGAKGWEGGESYEEMAARIVRAVGEIAAAHRGGHVLVVSHGGSVRAVHAHALGMEFHAYRRSAPVEPNARLSAVAVENGAFRLLHLPDEVPGASSS